VISGNAFNSKYFTSTGSGTLYGDSSILERAKDEWSLYEEWDEVESMSRGDRCPPPCYSSRTDDSVGMQSSGQLNPGTARAQSDPEESEDIEPTNEESDDL